MHYPLRGGEQYNVVVTFHSREQEEWGVTEGSRDEVLSYFERHLPAAAPAARPAEELAALGHGRPRADRAWTFGRVTLLGDAAHPMLQYLAQGACMALEDAVTLGEALRAHGGDFDARLRALRALARRAHRPRGADDPRDGPHLSTPRRRAAGAQRAVEGPHAGALLRALEWLYGWQVGSCLSA